MWLDLILLCLAVISLAIGSLLAFDQDSTVDLGMRVAAGVMFGGIAAILTAAAFGAFT